MEKQSVGLSLTPTLSVASSSSCIGFSQISKLPKQQSMTCFSKTGLTETLIHTPFARVLSAVDLSVLENFPHT